MVWGGVYRPKFFRHQITIQKENSQNMIDFWDANARALIAFGLMMIAALLTYIAFFKNSSSR